MIAKIKIVKLDGYVPGVKTTMDDKQAEVFEKAGKVKILEKESIKLAPDESNKKLGGKDGKNK